MSQDQFISKNLLGIVTSILLCLTYSSSIKAEGMRSFTQPYAHFNSGGELIRPTGYREWIFIGTPLTPNDMNNGKAAFPEFHNVYIDPTSWEHWKTKGRFPDGTVIVKELVSVGSKQASSGSGYFQGKYIGLEASVKSKKQFPNTLGNWGFFRFTVENDSVYKKVSSAQPDQNCLTCHKASADTDLVFTQYYPVLRAAKGKGQSGTGGM